ncbi:MAG: hypothetical protein LIO68_05075 [Rikenellaceae bacterium]|nr:hypothetical protein [Rikenellaceae bacterium]
MDSPIGAYLDDYTLLEQPGAAVQLYELVRAYPWFTLGRYMQLRALRGSDPAAYGRAWRRADVRLFAHPFPRLLLDEVSPENTEAGAAYIMPGPQYTDAAYGSRPDTVSVIDEFLSHANGAERIVPPPADAGYTQEDISAESVTEDGGIATETLAGIAHPFPRLLLDEVSPENTEAGAAYIMPGPQYTDAAYGSRPDTVSVIDEFLSHANGAERIVPPPADAGYTQEDISAESVTEDGGIATETLAGIYLAQGLPDRAVEIYYQLSLKYPEKSAYFANLIADVQARTGER